MSRSPSPVPPGLVPPGLIRPFLILSGLILPGLMLAGCASNGEFPSLAPRPIETAIKGGASGPSAPAPAVDAALKQRLDAAVEAGETAHGGFQAELARGREAIIKAQGASQGSEPWVGAQQARSAIDAARGGVTAALADLDALRRERADSASTADIAAIDEATSRLSALDQAEAQAVGSLSPL